MLTRCENLKSLSPEEFFYCRLLYRKLLYCLTIKTEDLYIKKPKANFNILFPTKATYFMLTNKYLNKRWILMLQLP